MCKVQGVCFATSSGVARVKGGHFRGDDLEGATEEPEGRRIDINSCFVRDFTFGCEEFDVEGGLVRESERINAEEVDCLEGERDRVRLIGRAFLLGLESNQPSSFPSHLRFRFPPPSLREALELMSCAARSTSPSQSAKASSTSS